jgi:hypothetical protein
MNILLAPLRAAKVIAHLAADYAFARWDESVARRHGQAWTMGEWRAEEARSGTSPYCIVIDETHLFTEPFPPELVERATEKTRGRLDLRP